MIEDIPDKQYYPAKIKRERFDELMSSSDEDPATNDVNIT